MAAVQAVHWQALIHQLTRQQLSPKNLQRWCGQLAQKERRACHALRAIQPLLPRLPLLPLLLQLLQLILLHQGVAYPLRS
jgi:hypothetical protein